MRFELDVHWIHRGGKDPVLILQDYADLVDLVHLKDYRIGPLGEDAFAALQGGRRAGLHGGLHRRRPVRRGRRREPGLHSRSSTRASPAGRSTSSSNRTTSTAVTRSTASSPPGTTSSHSATNTSSEAAKPSNCRENAARPAPTPKNHASVNSFRNLGTETPLICDFPTVSEVRGEGAAALCPLRELPFGADAAVELGQVLVLVEVERDLAAGPAGQVDGVGQPDAVDAVRSGAISGVPSRMLAAKFSSTPACWSPQADSNSIISVV